VPLLRRLTEEQWNRTGRHTEYPSYGVEQWLRSMANTRDHARQIQRNLKAFSSKA
jgi:hypothetical protein